MKRREFLRFAGLSSVASLPVLSGCGPVSLDSLSGNLPLFLSGTVEDDGQYRVVGFGPDGKEAFSVPSQWRTHEVTRHLESGLIVVPARRPGTQMLILEAQSGVLKQVIESPEGRHFYGHAVFNRDATALYATENDYQTGDGRLAVYTRQSNGLYARTADYSSGGVGPHQLALLPDDNLVIANGGLKTHPVSGRKRLNLDSMQSNLTYLNPVNGEIIEVQISPDQRLSLRHLDVNNEGVVAVGGQYQLDDAAKVLDVSQRSLPDLVYIHKRGGQLEALQCSNDVSAAMSLYTASVRFSANGKSVAVSCPKGNLLTLWDLAGRKLLNTRNLRDVAGVAAYRDGFVVSTGAGKILELDGGLKTLGSQTIEARRWDNHMTS